MASDAGGNPLCGTGARLRAARESRGLTLLQVAEKLHVDPRVLEALEAEDFAALGADVYVRGHLRRYAEAVGESPTALQELYAGSAHAARPDLTRIPRGEAQPRPSRLLLTALLSVLCVSIVGLLWWLLTLPAEKGQPLTAAPAPSAEVAAADAAAAAEPTRSATDGALPAGLRAPGPGEARLDLRFAALSWVEISDAGGRRLLSGLIDGGSERALSGTPPLRVVLGNAPAVALRLNGQPVTIAGLVHRDGSAHLSIDASGRASAAAPRLAHGD
ncbi:MAG TPA: RodZ domain-containing protein [Steroidobacteraceae bacterium]|nr:RodZ domain-containing protein [Steroidobacteraceae bacterium]